MGQVIWRGENEKLIGLKFINHDKSKVKQLFPKKKFNKVIIRELFKKYVKFLLCRERNQIPIVLSHAKHLILTLLTLTITTTETNVHCK